MTTLDTELAVRERYADAAKEREPSLCCPVDYDAKYLKVIPQEVIDRDYGCGDPSKHVREGETVLDLGSGGGKICFIASQVVGRHGRVIGVDMNDDMLALARSSQATVAQTIGYDNVTFCKGKIQDMAVDRDQVDQFLAEHPVKDEMGLRALEAHLAKMRAETPMVPDESVDVVVSNCVLNLVDTAEKEFLFDEIFRVLKPGGRAAISDIVSDQVVPEHLQADAELWSGCLSGALEQQAFVEAFEEAGFVDIKIESLQREPWQVVEGIAFRSMTVVAYRPHLASDEEGLHEQTVAFLQERGTTRHVYQGPFKHVVDDDGRVFTRGHVCEETLAMAAAGESIVGQFATFQTDAAPPNRVDGGPVTLPVSAAPCCGDDGCC